MINATLARGRETDYCVFALIALVLEVQVMRDGMFPTLVNGVETDNHIEFTPARLLYTKRWAFEGCIESLGQFMCPKYPNKSFFTYFGSLYPQKSRAICRLLCRSK